MTLPAGITPLDDEGGTGGGITLGVAPPGVAAPPAVVPPGVEAVAALTKTPFPPPGSPEGRAWRVRMTSVGIMGRV